MRKNWLMLNISISLIMMGIVPLSAWAARDYLPHLSRSEAHMIIQRGYAWIADARGPAGLISRSNEPTVTAMAVYGYFITYGPQPDTEAPTWVNEGLDAITNALTRGGAPATRAGRGAQSAATSSTNTQDLSAGMLAMLASGRSRSQRTAEGLLSQLTDLQVTDRTENRGGFRTTMSPNSPVEIVTTALALEALHAGEKFSGSSSGVDWKAAEDFITRCQTARGGFGMVPGRQNPDGLATSAGIVGLKACGAKANDSRVQSAKEWITQHFVLAENPGKDMAGRYYYYHMLAKALVFTDLREVPPKPGTDRHPGIALLKRLSGEAQAKKPRNLLFWTNSDSQWGENRAEMTTVQALLALGVIAPNSPDPNRPISPPVGTHTTTAATQDSSDETPSQAGRSPTDRFQQDPRMRGRQQPQPGQVQQPRRQRPTGSRRF